ncbi:expressed protein [Phakopsora pachyrhizi]|uniref:Expressed protein n=1 Tax=Phakopsora pachyrhizi TaxID=170000 RepID=A0AAV0BGB1_PHAPC|nr:hypothetical protein PPACK8108_LOCUS19365 [Phakopsora pachyrhizi]CAH7685240.1 expressed protein [Phakopsora pachyrhizi]
MGIYNIAAARLLSMTADTIDLLRTERGKGLSNMHSGLLRRRCTIVGVGTITVLNRSLLISSGLTRQESKQEQVSVNLSTKKQQLLPGGGNSSTAAIQGVPPPDVGAGQRTPKKDSRQSANRQ